jgi:hypothetical protein
VARDHGFVKNFEVFKLEAICTMSILTMQLPLISVPTKSGQGPTGIAHLSCTDIVHRGNKKILNTGAIFFGSQFFEEKNSFWSVLSVVQFLQPISEK